MQTTSMKERDLFPSLTKCTKFGTKLSSLALTFTSGTGESQQKKSGTGCLGIQYTQTKTSPRESQVTLSKFDLLREMKKHARVILQYWIETYFSVQAYIPCKLAKIGSAISGDVLFDGVFRQIAQQRSINILRVHFSCISGQSSEGEIG